MAKVAAAPLFVRKGIFLFGMEPLLFEWELLLGQRSIDWGRPMPPTAWRSARKVEQDVAGLTGFATEPTYMDTRSLDKQGCPYAAWKLRERPLIWLC